MDPPSRRVVPVVIRARLLSGNGYLLMRISMRNPIYGLAHPLSVNLLRCIQMQQVLNAGLSYYVVNGTWPTQMSDLQGTYLPPASVPFVNPWGNDYLIATSPTTQLFYVYTQINTVSSGAANSTATILAGTL